MFCLSRHQYFIIKDYNGHRHCLLGFLRALKYCLEILVDDSCYVGFERALDAEVDLAWGDNIFR